MDCKRQRSRRGPQLVALPATQTAEGMRLKLRRSTRYLRKRRREGCFFVLGLNVGPIFRSKRDRIHWERKQKVLTAINFHEPLIFAGLNAVTSTSIGRS